MKKYVRFLALILITVTFGGQAYAGLVLNGNDDFHIGLGATFGATGWMTGVDASGTQRYASVSLFDSEGRLGLISAHQVLNDKLDRGSFFTNIRVGFGSNIFTNPGIVYTPAEVIVHPTEDWGVLVFPDTIPGVTPYERYRGEVVNGDEGFLVGYGRRQYVNDPAEDFTGDRRAGFDVVENNAAGTFETRFNRSFAANYREGEMGARPGDSGGSFVLSNGLLGGLAIQTSIGNLYNTSTIYADLNNVAIDEIRSSRISTVPEPASWVLFGVGMLGGAFRRSRRQSQSA